MTRPPPKRYYVVTWIGERTDLDARPGGTFAVDFVGPAARGSYVVVDPPHRVLFTWGSLDDPTMPPGSSTVEVGLIADGADTIVNLTHRDLPPDREPSHAMVGMAAWPCSSLPFASER